MGGTKKPLRPVILCIICLLSLLATSQFIAYLQYQMLKQQEHEALITELNSIKDKLYSVIYNDITAASTLAIIYKEYGVPDNYDSIAKQIISNSKYAEAVQLTDNGIITHIYPLKGYENTIGINTGNDSLRKKESQEAGNKANVFIAGPRKLRQGGTGILVKVPITINGERKGLAVVLTKLETLRKAMGINDSSKRKFAYKIEKKGLVSDTVNYLQTAAVPIKNANYVSLTIPEGNWTISVCSADGIPLTNVYLISIFGLLFSIIVTAYVYSRATATQKLEHIVEAKTHLLGERVKELSTIFIVNEILKDDTQPAEDVFQKIVRVLPHGWQYPDVCEARIVFDGEEFTTHGYIDVPDKQSAGFSLQDGRSGLIEIVYTQKKPIEDEGVFLTEERKLINTIAETIQVFFDKKATQDGLQKSEANLRSIFDNTQIGYMLMDKDMNIVSLNHTMTEGYLQYAGNRCKAGDNFIDRLPADKRDSRRKIFTDIISAKQAFEYETSYTKNGITNYFVVSIVPVIADEEVIGLCMASYDITTRKQMELERQQIINDLVQRNKDLEQFAHILSHNVRAPLATLLGLTDMLQNDISTAESTAINNGIKESAGHLDIIIKDLNRILDVKRDLSEVRSEIVLQDVVEEIKHMLVTIIKDKEAQIVYDFTAASKLVSVRSFIHSILYNLISNALKYTANGIMPQVFIVSEVKHNKLYIIVKDNGMGIDLNKHGEHLFGLYKRFHPDVEGRGLGLFMVKTQVESINGHIEVHSEPDKGTTFKVSFNLADVA